jgi:hypothetical protein
MRGKNVLPLPDTHKNASRKAGPNSFERSHCIQEGSFIKQVFVPAGKIKAQIKAQIKAFLLEPTLQPLHSQLEH